MKIYLVENDEGDYDGSYITYRALFTSAEVAAEVVYSKRLKGSSITELELDSPDDSANTDFKMLEIDWNRLIKPEFAIGKFVRILPEGLHPNVGLSRRAMAESGEYFEIKERRMRGWWKLDVRLITPKGQPLWFHEYQVELKEE